MDAHFEGPRQGREQQGRDIIVGTNFEGARNQVQVQDDSGSTETKLDNLKTNQVRCRRDIKEAREVKKHSSRLGTWEPQRGRTPRRGTRRGAMPRRWGGAGTRTS